MNIHGLRIEDASPCCDSKRRVLPESKPFYIVFHGSTNFEHEHFGVHLGQEDHLTFLGEVEQQFWGHFLDCRADSPTYRIRQTVSFFPNVKKTLVIPAGVAHAFQGMENIYTINNYVLYLPDKGNLCLEGTDWNIENDVINIPMDCSSGDIPSFIPNFHRASRLFYQILSQSHRANLEDGDKNYPIVQDFETTDQGTVRLRFKTLEQQHLTVDRTKRWLEVLKIKEIYWRKHLTILSGKDSGIYVVPEFSHVTIVESPFELIKTVPRIPGGSMIYITFLSPREVIINISLTSDNHAPEWKTFHIPGTGEYEALFNPEATIACSQNGVYAVVRSQ